VREKVAIAGSGAIATGLAATVAVHHGDVLLVARSQDSADRAHKRAARLLERMEPGHGTIEVVTDLGALADTTIAVEAIVEELESKASLYAELHTVLPASAIIATTTSSLSVEQLAAASGRPERFAGLHVFNPVPRMELVELVFPAAAADDVRDRVRNLCRDLAKTAVEVPDTPGFVVNRLLFPYLFDAVTFLTETGLEPAAVDRCMTLGTGHPMGPLALLDFVGLDVATAIGEQIGAEVPARVRELAADGALGKKAGRGFYDY
jgi:3-hydroxyacyl-CoA dehydrogenase